LADASFEEIFAQYEQKIFNLVLRMVGNYEEAVDLTSETFFQALRALPSFRRQAQPYTWLYRIAVNLCKNHFRKSAHRARHHAFSLDQGRPDDLEAVIEIEDNAAEPERLLESYELQREVERAIAALPPDMRIAIVLRDLQGLSYQEIAEALDCTLEAVKSRLFRARAALRKQLEPYMKDSE
jgi:RNA polymerase sigma-70 factor, ECF subfamily